MPLGTLDEQVCAAVPGGKISSDDQMFPTDPAAFVRSLFRDQDAILIGVFHVSSPKSAQFAQELP
ncbi:MAG: hypothetical protein ACE5R6_05625 [Candidatus Heimdallarchaeota archaeon]